MKTKAPFGTWSSVIKPRMLAGANRLGDVGWDSDGETLVWSETRAYPGGATTVLVAQRPGDGLRDLTDSDQSVRGRVGYGGGEFTVRGGQVVFAGNGGRLYRVPVSGGTVKAITPPFGAAASPAISPDGSWVVYVHHYQNTDGLALVDLDGAHFPRKFAYGTDFVMQPVWSPDGTHLAYVTWDHPNMPWDGAEIRLARAGRDAAGVPILESVSVIAGGADTAVMQPEFSPDGKTLAYLSDQSGWWQLYLYDLASGNHRQFTNEQVEHGTPAWVQGIRLYGWSADSRGLWIMRNQPGGFWELGRADAARGGFEPVALEGYNYLRQIAVAPGSDRIALIAGSPVQSDRIITLEPDDEADDVIAPLLSDDQPTMSVLVDAPRRVFIRRRSSTESIPPSLLSSPQPVSWESFDGELAHGVYFPPVSDHYECPGVPPLIVNVHGGPTSQQRLQFDGAIQFFTTRGYAVLTPNHRGSTGYGREYMLKHRGMWGVYDVEDSARGATYLAGEGLADPTRLIIMGGSAGGYTVLQSLVTMPGFYAAGVCAYGISDQFALLLDGADWKFESRYNEKMIGLLPDDAERYRERSPLFHADQIADPVILFHGDADEAVPIVQSEAIAASLKRRGVPHEYHVYAGEGHGWRKPETIEHYYNAILAFLRKHVLFR